MRNLQDKDGLVSWRLSNKFHSELEEELVAIDYFDCKKNGFVLDIGAADGITASNSFRLINEYDWHGLLIEPCKRHISNLKILYDDVDDVDCFFGAIDQHKKETIFYEVSEHEIGYSNTVGELYTRDQGFTTYSVPCLDINSVLKKYNVPKVIDFVSLDIEGSEKQVLDNWNFDDYDVSLWCVERNNDINYESFFTLHGYEKITTSNFNICHYNCFYSKRY